MSSRGAASGQRRDPRAGRRLAGRHTLLLLLCIAGSWGCATYSDRMGETRDVVAGGDYQSGVQRIDKILDVDQPGQIPNKFDSDSALALLERGTLMQALQAYPPSAGDFQAADKALEVLDLADDTAGNIGKYVYSDSATKYQTTPMEKLCLNSFNMMNYLAMGDLAGARVEARRFTVMRQYLQSIEQDRTPAAFGSYLAGFAFEQLGEWQSAMRYYDEALDDHAFASLRAPVARMATRSPYRGRNLGKLIAQGTAAGEVGDGELLVVVNVGRVPHKVPERIPVGAAVGIAGAWISGNPDVLGHSAMKVVVYPELVSSESIYRGVALSVDGRQAPLELATDVGSEIRREYEEIKPRIIGAALSRMIVRAAAAEGMRQAGNQQSAGLGWALAILTEGLLVAMDKPDTRSWMMLPDKVYVARHRVPAGKHTVQVTLRSDTPEQIVNEVEVKPGAYAAIIITAPR